VSWFLVGDQMHSAPLFRKITAIEPAAVGLWTAAGSWSSEFHTDGFIPDDDLPWLFPDALKLARALVTAGAWKRVRNGHRFVPDGVTHKISSREQWEAEKQAAAERQRRSRQGRTSRRDTPVTDAVTHAGSHNAQSNPIKSVVDVINHVAGSNALVDEDLILKSIIDSIHERTGRVIGAAHARIIAASLLEGRQPRDRVAYCQTAIRREPNPAQRFLPAGSSDLPPQCGRCSPARRLEDDDGHDLGPCPTCHPASQNGTQP
jgi:hypothetical protein